MLINNSLYSIPTPFAARIALFVLQIYEKVLFVQRNASKKREKKEHSISIISTLIRSSRIKIEDALHLLPFFGATSIGCSTLVLRDKSLPLRLSRASCDARHHLCPIILLK